MHKIKELFNIGNGRNLINVGITALGFKLIVSAYNFGGFDITSISDLFRILSCGKHYLHTSPSAKKFCWRRRQSKWCEQFSTGSW